MPNVEELLFDDDNDLKFAAHNLSQNQVSQLLDSEFLVIPNRDKRRATFLLIGRDHGGTYIAVPIEPTYDPRLWRPVTAWRCKEHERAIYDHKRRTK